MNTLEKIAESNRIEGILRDPTTAEIIEHDRFIGAPILTIDELKAFIRIYQPDAIIRDRKGLDVRVGTYSPPKGGPHIIEKLQNLLNAINTRQVDALEAHVSYELLHPFTDGNGRSGRALWYWMMPGNTLGFLHTFYYQALKKFSP